MKKMFTNTTKGHYDMNGIQMRWLEYFEHYPTHWRPGRGCREVLSGFQTHDFGSIKKKVMACGSGPATPIG